MFGLAVCGGSWDQQREIIASAIDLYKKQEMKGNILFS